jgi:2'-5' RNA ligase
VRAFVAIPLPEPLREELAAYAAGAAAGLSGHPTPAGNLHVTIHFLGAVDDVVERPLVAALRPACASVEPMALRIIGAALAPPRRPRMVWARLEAPPGLAALALAVAAAAAPFAPGAREPRTAKPHVTLARLRLPPPRGAELPPLAAAGAEIAVAACALVRSDLGRDGARYTTLAELPVGRGSLGSDPAPKASHPCHDRRCGV